MEFVIALFIGCVIGALIRGVWPKKKTLGTIRVNNSDPDEPPYLFLELRTSVADVMSHKTATFDVSQK